MRNRLRKQRQGSLRCPRCRLHRDLCLCTLLIPLPVATRLVLLTHVTEREKPSNTGHLAVACLEGAREIVRGSKHDEPLPPLWDSASTPLLLFPTPDAVTLPAWIDAHPNTRVTLLVPDGTWRQCKRVRRRVPGMDQAIPVTLPFAGPSQYRLRHAPHENQLCTLEAIARALHYLEGPEVEAHLLHIFRMAVDRTLWTNGRIATEAVFGGIPEGARKDGPRPMVADPELDPGCEL